MIASIVITIVLVVFCIRQILRMVRNVKEGRCIDGCGGDCSHCQYKNENASKDAHENASENADKNTDEKKEK